MSASTSIAQASMEFLSSADDLLTRLLLDFSIFEQPKLGGRSTAKINRFARELRMSDDEVVRAREFVKELRKGTTTVDSSLDKLLAFPSVKAFNKKWEEEGMFANHAKRYILALRPDSGVAFHEVDRYKNPHAAATAGGGGGGVSARARGKKKTLPAVAAVMARKDPEATIELGTFATRPFKKGETLHLRGGLADLTDEQDDELRGAGGRSDFSVLWSQRKQCFSLLLGPASKVNHDCRNNVEFQLNGAHMTFKVIEDIAKDEELFTHYGEHYFEKDNASCLCATCEQLEKGAFTPPAPAQPKKESKPKPAPSTPSRRSHRAVADVNYDENALSAPVASTSASGHSLTAQRSLRGALSRSSSLSSLTSPSKPSRPGSPARSSRSRTAPSRINPSRISAIDVLRSQPRTVVQVKLAPPPGYARDYQWDNKKKVAKYVGPTTCPADDVPVKRKPTTSGLSRSASAPSHLNSLGKRRRSASDSPQPTRVRNRDGPKRPRQSMVQLPPARYGERSSKRITGATASARERAFEKLRRAMGGAEEAGEESDLSELDETIESEEDKEDEEEEEGDEESEEAQQASEEEAKEVEAMLSPARRRSVSRVEETPLPFSMPGLASSSAHAGAPASTSSAATAPSLVASRSTRSTRSSLSTSVEATAAGPVPRALAVDVAMSTSTPAEETFSPSLHAPSSHGDEEEEDRIVLCEVPNDSNEKDSTPRSRSSSRHPITTPSFYSPAVDTGEGSTNAGSSAAGQPDFCVAHSAAGGGNTRLPTGVGDGGGGGGLGGGGGGGGGDDPRRNRERVLPVDKMDVEVEEEEKANLDENLTVAGSGKGDETAAPAEEPVVSINHDPEDAAAALLMLLSAPLSNSSARTPSSTAPTPPTHDSSAISSGSTDASTSASTVEIDSLRKKGKRKRLSDESQPSPPPPLNPRSTRRQPKLDSPAPDPPPEPEEELADVDVKGKGKATQPVAKRARSAATAEAAAKPKGRRTRGTNPLAGSLADVLYAPETLASLGGYDFEKGRYISKHEAIRAPSHNPRPKPRSPSPASTPSPPPVSRKSTFAKPAPKRARLSQSPAAGIPRTPAASSSRFSSSTTSHRSSLPGPTTTMSTPSAAPPDGRRATRKSFPIAQSFRDFIYSPAVLAASGGYDEEKGTYVSAAAAASTSTTVPFSSTTSRRSSSAGFPSTSAPIKRVARPSSASPAATSNSSTSAPPPDEVRSTRRSFPLGGTKLQDLVYGEAARAASGGWDPVQGRYVAAGKGGG
ncbi:hypothetical protein JCM11251_003069 [Rhodosporidiobolus azoricus]